MDEVSVTLLGGFRVTVDGAPVSPDAWRSRRAADVVKLLALAPQHRMRREQLIDALWPDLEPDAAAANLRKAVHYARRALGGEEAISVAGGVLELWPAARVGTDVDAFLASSTAALRSTTTADAAHAADLYAGDLLPDDRYEQWSEPHRERLAQRHLQMLRAAQQWERVIEIDPYDEAAYRALMRRALHSGNRAAALRLFEQLRDRLHAELGVAPSAATVQLHRAIFAVEPPAQARPAEQVRSLIARGMLNYWGRTNLAEAEALAARARHLAIDAGLGSEVGEASALLAIVSMYSGTWWRRFHADLRFAMGQPPDVATAIFDAMLCFVEFYMDGPEGLGEPDAVARQALQLATEAGSVEGEALARLMAGEVELLAGRAEHAADELGRSAQLAAGAGWVGCRSLALQHAAEAALALQRRTDGAAMAEESARLAGRSSLAFHLLVRALDAKVNCAEDQVEALTAAEAVRRGTPACEPCSIGYLTSAIGVWAAAGRTQDASRLLVEAERISGLWAGGPWRAAVWEARARIRSAEGDRAMAAAFFSEAAQGFAKSNRPLAQARCLEAAAALA